MLDGRKDQGSAGLSAAKSVPRARSTERRSSPAATRPRLQFRTLLEQGHDRPDDRNPSTSCRFQLSGYRQHRRSRRAQTQKVCD
jgi:hypothetical protein